MRFRVNTTSVSSRGNGYDGYLSVFVVKAVLLRWLAVMKPTF